MNIVVRGLSVAKRLLFQKEVQTKLFHDECPALVALDEAKKMADTKPNIKDWKVEIHAEEKSNSGGNKF